MPSNKDAYIRYHVIDGCLRNRQRKYPSKKYLKEKCGEVLGKDISLSTIEKDILDMREHTGLKFFAPIKYSAFNRGYCYEDENYSISKLPIDPEDVGTLRFAGELAKLFGNWISFGELDEVLNRLSGYLKLENLQPDESLSDFIQLENKPAVAGLQWFETLLTAIKNEQVIDLLHQSFERDRPLNHIVEPYLLKEYEGRWYLLARNAEKKFFRTFGLDRIKEVTVTQKQFTRDKDFNAADFYKNLYGVIASGDPPEEVVLSFTPRQGKYILTKPLHNTQEILRDNKDEFRIKIFVSPTYELYMDVLHFGAEVKVIKPASLKRWIKEEIEKMKQMYKQA